MSIPAGCCCSSASLLCLMTRLVWRIACLSPVKLNSTAKHLASRDIDHRRRSAEQERGRWKAVCIQLTYSLPLSDAVYRILLSFQLLYDLFKKGLLLRFAHLMKTSGTKVQKPSISRSCGLIVMKSNGHYATSTSQRLIHPSPACPMPRRQGPLSYLLEESPEEAKNKRSRPWLVGSCIYICHGRLWFEHRTLTVP
jgi:hypothetical protein